MKITIQFYIFELVFFWIWILGSTNNIGFLKQIFPQKGYFRSKTEQVNITIVLIIFELAEVPNCNLNGQFWFFGPIWPKRVFPVKNGKSERHHWILHIQISLSNEFCFKQTVLNCGTNFAQKRCLPKYHHWILHIWISLGAKFEFKLTI